VELNTNGDVLREGASHGIFMRKNSLGQISNEYICGMTEYGIEITSDAGAALQPIEVHGTSSVLSSRGVHLQVESGMVAEVEFGTDEVPGSNAFAGNSDRNFHVVTGAAEVVSARGNQWQNCYTGQSNRNCCKTSSISSNDLNNSSVANVGSTSSCSPSTGCLPHQADTVGLVIGEVYPKKGLRDSLVHISGTGFDAISGNTSGNCRTLKNNNKCSPMQGTCVQFLERVVVDGEEQYVPTSNQPDVLAVTPTSLVVRAPVDCRGPMKIRVNRLGPGGNPLPIPAVIDFCRN
jgi:hypothetical protein